MKIKSKAYCKGLLCNKSDRRFKSFISKKYMCSICAIPVQGKGHCTIDEYIKPNIDWDKIDTEFEEMLTTLNLRGAIKDAKKKKIYKERKVVSSSR